MRFICPLLLCLALLNGCRKADRNSDTDLTLAEDAANAQAGLFEAFLATHEACLATPGIKSFIACASVTTDTLGLPRTMVVDFGTGCNAPTGRTRTGKIIVHQSGSYTQGGSTSQVHFDTFYLNGYNYSGSLGLSTLGATAWKLSPGNLVISAPDSSFVYILNGTLTLSQTAGTATVPAGDDVFDISGTLELTGRKGNTGTCTVNSGQVMVMSASCASFVSGLITVNASGQGPRVIDFGAGTCDRQASVTANTQSSSLNISF